METKTQPTGNMSAQSSPHVKSVTKLIPTISNPEGTLYPPEVLRAWWATSMFGEIVEINVTVNVYLPDIRGGFDTRNISVGRQESGMFLFYVTYDAPEIEPVTWQQYQVVFVDTIDPGSFENDFNIELFLQDKDPKTSRGTVTTVMPSSMIDR